MIKSLIVVFFLFLVFFSYLFIQEQTTSIEDFNVWSIATIKHSYNTNSIQAKSEKSTKPRVAALGPCNLEKADQSTKADSKVLKTQ